MESIANLIRACLADAQSIGPCGPEDPWEEAMGLTHMDAEACWSFIAGYVRDATTAYQFGKVAAGPIAYFWTEHGDQYLDRLSDLASELPQLVNLVIADDRRIMRAAHVMNMIYALSGGKFRDGKPLDLSFVYEPPQELERLVMPGAHPVTESLLVPNWHSFHIRRAKRKRVTQEELQEIVDGYIRAPSPPDDDEEDDWWWAVNSLVHDSPEQAWDAMLAILARTKEGVDIGMLGAGDLETLIANRAEELLPQIEAELETNRTFVKAVSSANLFSLSEQALMSLEAKCRPLLAVG